jgi:hypothetical protein
MLILLTACGERPGVPRSSRAQSTPVRENCPYPSFLPTTFPWLSRGEKPARPTRFLDEPPSEDDAATLYWSWPSRGIGNYVLLSRQSRTLKGSGPGEEIVPVSIAGDPEGEMFLAPGDASIYWDTGEARCSEYLLSVTTRFLSRDDAMEAALKTARSLARADSDATTDPRETEEVRLIGSAPCPLVNVAGPGYELSVSPRRGEPGDVLVISRLTLRDEGWRWHPATKIEVWWNLKSGLPGPESVLLARFDPERACRFRLTTTVPGVPTGSYPINTITYWKGEFGWGVPVPFHVR